MTEQLEKIAAQRATEEAARCNRCGYCQAVCPTHAVTGLETAVARGRNQLVTAAAYNAVEATRRLRATVFECLLCGACTVQCFPAVRTYEVMAFARASVVGNGGPPALQRYVFRELLPRRDRLDRLVRLVSLGKRSGLSGAVQALRIVGWYGRSLAEAERIVDAVPRLFLRERLQEIDVLPRASSADVVYFTGCAMNYALPEAGLATLRALKQAGLQVVAPDNVCCGLPAFAYGDLVAAKDLARRNIQHLLAIQLRWITSDCASCSSFLKEYPTLFADEPEWQEKAALLVERVRDATQLLAETGYSPATKVRNETVTYHDPCHLAHHLREREASRELLRRAFGERFVDMEESDWCCGGAGSYNVAHPDLSLRILERKMTNVRNTGAGLLATACPACVIQLRYGARRFGVPVRVLHLSEVLAAESHTGFRKNDVQTVRGTG